MRERQWLNRKSGHPELGDLADYIHLEKIDKQDPGTQWLKGCPLINYSFKIANFYRLTTSLSMIIFWISPFVMKDSRKNSIKD